MVAAPIRIQPTSTEYFCDACYDEGLPEKECVYVLQCPRHGRVASGVTPGQAVPPGQPFKVERWVNGDEGRESTADRELVRSVNPVRAGVREPGNPLVEQRDAIGVVQGTPQSQEAFVRAAAAQAGPIVAALLEAVIRMDDAPSWPDLDLWLREAMRADVVPNAVVLAGQSLNLRRQRAPQPLAAGDDDRQPALSRVSVANGTLVQTETPEDAAAEIERALAEAKAESRSGALVEPDTEDPTTVDPAPAKPNKTAAARAAKAAKRAQEKPSAA